MINVEDHAAIFRMANATIIKMFASAFFLLRTFLPPPPSCCLFGIFESLDLEHVHARREHVVAIGDEPVVSIEETRFLKRPFTLSTAQGTAILYGKNCRLVRTYPHLFTGLHAPAMHRSIPQGYHCRRLHPANIAVLP